MQESPPISMSSGPAGAYSMTVDADDGSGGGRAGTRLRKRPRHGAAEVNYDDGSDSEYVPLDDEDAEAEAEADVEADDDSDGDSDADSDADSDDFDAEAAPSTKGKVAAVRPIGILARTSTKPASLASSGPRFGTPAVLVKSDERVSYFGLDLPTLMYGAGDSSKPLEQTAEVVEDLVMQFIKSIMVRVKQFSDSRGTIHLEDVLHVIRDDGKKHLRARELLAIDKYIREVKNSEKRMGDQVAKDEGGTMPPIVMPRDGGGGGGGSSRGSRTAPITYGAPGTVLPTPDGKAPIHPSQIRIVGQNEPPPLGPDGLPMKRKRGRPRKVRFVE